MKILNKSTWFMCRVPRPQALLRLFLFSLRGRKRFDIRREYDIYLIGPAQSNGRWQQVQGNGFDISNFRVEWDREKVICPAGRESTSWKPKGKTPYEILLEQIKSNPTSTEVISSICNIQVRGEGETYSLDFTAETWIDLAHQPTVASSTSIVTFSHL